jgi:hypothetical protein
MVLPVVAAEKKHIPHVPGSRFTYIHRLPLLDGEGKPVKPDDDVPQPFNFKATCTTKCHDFGQISQGWHFNATDPKADPGRPGQPWFWADKKTGTQLPLSYRAWPNTWRPAQVGLTNWSFIQNFGHHMPGGGPGEDISMDEPGSRWLVSGKLGVNCAACHSGAPAYDHVEWFLQIAGQNFMWAGAAATEICDVTGAARGMPDFYDPLMGPEDEKMAKTAPTVRYNKSKIDSKGRVFFDLPAAPPDQRCLFCHNTMDVGPGTPEAWKSDVDIHLASGMTCSDCHRHGENHKVTRGYEGEAQGADAAVRTLTCRGCHLGDESAASGPDTAGGRLGAPVPVHVGLPTIHLEKLTCTTCHSGPYPKEQAGYVQTSMAHALEFQGAFRGPKAMPYVVGPVFARRAYDHDRIGPQYMVWPSFWARVDGDTVTPLMPDVVKDVAKDAFEKGGDETEQPAVEPSTDPAADKAAGAPAEAGDAGAAAKEAAAPAVEEMKAPADAAHEHIAAGIVKPAEAGPRDLTPQRVLAIMAALKAQPGAKGEPVYVTGGKMWRAGADGKLTGAPHAAAEPAAWPIGHNVRGAGRSLGVKGCTDCHGFGAPVAFGEVPVTSPAYLEPTVLKAMYEFQGRDKMTLQAWAMSYMFRPMFKVVGFVTAGLMAAVLLLYLFLGLAALLRWAGTKAPQGPSL